jgi:hypothetical protein
MFKRYLPVLVAAAMSVTVLPVDAAADGPPRAWAGTRHVKAKLFKKEWCWGVSTSEIDPDLAAPCAARNIEWKNIPLFRMQRYTPLRFDLGFDPSRVTIRKANGRGRPETLRPTEGTRWEVNRGRLLILRAERRQPHEFVEHVFRVRLMCTCIP